MIHSVPVPEASRPYIEYVGANPSTRAARSAERLQDVLEHLVRPVRRPDAVGVEPVTEVRGEGARAVA